MFGSLFEFFEVIADELSTENSRVLTRFDLQVGHEESTLLDDLQCEMRAGSSDEAIERAVAGLRRHFEGKGAQLPFTYDPNTGRFTATDPPFLAFVKDMSSIRSVGGRSRDFECRVAERLGQRATGTVHRVGFPRNTKKNKRDFNGYLRTLGFGRPVLLGKEKDGGLDILWLLPLGTIPHRPIVSVQCKNGEFDITVADSSVGAGSRSFAQHAGLQGGVHVPCVLFNDYIEPEGLTPKPLNFVPLGLTDLALLHRQITVNCI
jgi:hypothetical protein